MAISALGVARSLSRCSSLRSLVRRTCNEAPFSKPAEILSIWGSSCSAALKSAIAGLVSVPSFESATPELVASTRTNDAIAVISV